jgi:hypothetical protein
VPINSLISHRTRHLRRTHAGARSASARVGAHSSSTDGVTLLQQDLQQARHLLLEGRLLLVLSGRCPAESASATGSTAGWRSRRDHGRRPLTVGSPAAAAGPWGAAGAGAPPRRQRQRPALARRASGGGGGGGAAATAPARRRGAGQHAPRRMGRRLRYRPTTLHRRGGGRRRRRRRSRRHAAAVRRTAQRQGCQGAALVVDAA